MTRDTVIGDTPARRATSLIVGAVPARREGLDRVEVLALMRRWLAQPPATASRTPGPMTTRMVAGPHLPLYGSAIRRYDGVTGLAEDRHGKES
jgi:hypothetical protein